MQTHRDQEHTGLASNHQVNTLGTCWDSVGSIGSRYMDQGRSSLGIESCSSCPCNSYIGRHHWKSIADSTPSELNRGKGGALCNLDERLTAYLFSKTHRMAQRTSFTWRYAGEMSLFDSTRTPRDFQRTIDQLRLGQEDLSLFADGNAHLPTSP